MTQFPSSDELEPIVRAIVDIAPPGWQSMAVVYEEVGSSTAYTARATSEAGQSNGTGKLDRDARRLLSELRTRMYKPGAGAWYTATVVVQASGGFTIDFDYDHEPESVFAPVSWSEDAERFPRTPAATPAWLAVKTGQPEWGGARWQCDFTADGSPVDDDTSMDATTTPEARARLVQVAERLAASGVGVREEQDEGEDDEGNPVPYDKLSVDVGDGYMAVCFWRSLIFWSVDVHVEHVDGDRFRQVARAVLQAVEATGFRAASAFGEYDRKLLGLESV